MFSKRSLHALRLLLLVSVLAAMIPATFATPLPVYAASEAPHVIVDKAMTDYSAPSPGLFYDQIAVCPDDGGPALAATTSTASPDAPQGATPFVINRTTVRDEGARSLQYVTDSSVDPACAPYKIQSNLLADANFVYWVDATGLVKLPVTANYYDTPTLMNAAYAPYTVELADAGDHLIAVSNAAVGGTYVESVDKVSGDYTGIYHITENKKFHDVKVSGKYIYAIDKDRILVKIDTSGDPAHVTSIGGHVSDYSPEGEVTTCPTISCTTSDYVIYAADNSIRRYNNTPTGSQPVDEPIQNLPSDATVSTLITTNFLGLGTVFYFQSIAEPIGGLGGNNYTFSLFRAGDFPFDSPELLYTYDDSDGINGPAKAPAQLSTDGTFLFWTEGGAGASDNSLKRLPNDVDALPKVDMTITGMEVTQGVQNNNNTVRLVHGRETYVRVFVHGDSDVPGATMRLYATYGGSEHGPYRPINGTHLTAKVAPDRNQIGDAFLFVLPWEASSQSNVSLRAVINPYKIPQEPNYGNNEFTSGPYTFSPGRSIDLIFVESNYCLQRSLLDCPQYDVNDVDASVDYMRRAYPIPEDGIHYRTWAINGGPLLGNYVLQNLDVCQKMPASTRSLCASDWVNAKIGGMRANAGNGINAATLTYGLIPDSSTTGGAFPRGQAGSDRIGSGPTGSSIISGTVSISYSDFGYYSGHEIGHEFGRQHPVPNSDDPTTTVDKAGNAIVEGCGHSRDDASYPYALARIGPGDGSVRGFDRAFPSSRGYPQPRVLDDVNSYDMMSYCGNAQTRWPSDYTWEGLYESIINPPAQAAQAALDGDFLSLFGVIYGDDVIVHSVERLQSVTEKTAGESGAWRLRLLDAKGKELAAYLFDAGDASIGEDEGQAFGVTVDFAPGTRSYEIVNVASGEKAFSGKVSANAPTVSNVALDSPSSPVSGTVTLKWEAADADNDKLSYDIFYSADAGASYQPVVLGVSDTSTPVDTSTLAGGQGRFRIYANDGANQGQGDSPDYTLAVKAPTVRIIQPANGQHFNWGDMVNFSGEGLDPQDGLIQGPSATWSNQNGVLGTGGQISRADLPVGANLITLSVQNSAGETASKQITIYVDDPLALPGPTLALAPSSLSFVVEAGKTAKQTATINLVNTGQGALTWSAVSDASWLTLDVASGDVPATVTATADPSGLAINQLYSANITFTGVATGYPDQIVTVPVAMSIGNSFINPTGLSPQQQFSSAIFLPALSK